MLLFLISITPKKYFHDLIADHTDDSLTTINHATSVNNAGINCHFQNLVVESPFTWYPSLINFGFVPENAIEFSVDLPFYLFRHILSRDNKGPPALIA
jgi:hypothetical protein